MSDATVITDLAAELPLTEDGTLSRVLYRDDRLRVVGFAFATGQELTEHTSALPVVIQVVRGRPDLVLGEDKTEALPGTWIHLPARLPHSVRATEPTIMLLTMFAAPEASAAA
ncbi:cupin domain-containing protein [Streptomyces ipomoeae]|uniref:cupin domain-containing protein n=1 Tax=Streptomyces ipomoeae TaxID=103232 RepID=UPI001146E5C9|nr:cupin domain-containing protein [Streptomyces ipomoeae]MDX2934001.1 cupin domain-containing protein [Streptomyces ipomoeae]TQE28752.1 cupin [Streptomyces ipomoeae]